MFSNDFLSLCCVQSIRAINGSTSEISAENFANMVFEKIDVDGDGKTGGRNLQTFDNT